MLWIIFQLWQGATSDKLHCGDKDWLPSVQRDSARGQQAAMNFVPEILHVNTNKAVISHYKNTCMVTAGIYRLWRRKFSKVLNRDLCSLKPMEALLFYHLLTQW